MSTRFLYDDRWRYGLCASSSNELGYVPDTTRNPLREFPWRSGTGSSSQWISCDTGGTSPATFVAIANPVIVGMSGTLKLQSSPDNATWTDVVTISTGVNPLTRLWTAYFTQVSARYFRVYWLWATGTGYLEFGTIRVGTYFQPTYDPDLPLNLIRTDLSRLTYGSSGNVSRSVQNKQYTFDLNFPAMPLADVTAFDLMFETVGVGSSFFVTVDHTNLEETWYAYFKSPLHKEPIAGTTWDVQLSMQESM